MVCTNKITKNKMDAILKEKILSRYKLSALINYPEATLNQVVNLKRNFPEELIQKIAPILEVSENEIKSWILADKYPKAILEKAHACKLAKGKSKELMITVKIDELLEKESLSRTKLSKLINYSQSGLNAMIIGKRPFSKTVMIRISESLNIPFEDLRACWLADRYPLEILALAIDTNQTTFL